MATNGGPDITQEGLVFVVDAANKKSYPGSGTTLKDLAGSNNGTLINGPTFDSGDGGSIDFDGTNDYFQADTNLGITGNSPRTFECWAYIESNTSKNIMGGCTPSNGKMFDTITWYTNGYLRVVGHYYGSGFDTLSSLPSRNTLNINQWNQIINLYDGSDVSIYTNGEFSNSKSLTLNSGDGKVRFARGYYSPYDYFGGRLSSMKVYNRALSSTEILQNYNALKGRFGL